MNKNIKIAIIGLGYVGLPLSLEFEKNLEQLVLIFQKKNTIIKK